MANNISDKDQTLAYEVIRLLPMSCLSKVLTQISLNVDSLIYPNTVI